MRNFVLKVIVTAGAILLTWVITTSILAHFKHEKPAELSPDIITASKKVVDQVDKLKPASILQNQPRGNSQSLKRFSANAQGNILDVEAEVEINDQRQDRCYVWTLYVLHAGDDSPQLIHVYDNQVFTIPDSGNLNPTFQERTELPSGNYKVILTLSRLAKDADLSTLKDPEILKVPISLRGFGTVKID